MKHMTKDELRAHGETLPIAYTYDAQGNELTFKDGNGYWRGVSNEEIDKERARLKQVLKNLKRSKKLIESKLN